jgi:hypothetical protein
MRKVTKQTTPGCGFYLSPTFASPQSNSSTWQVGQQACHLKVVDPRNLWVDQHRNLVNRPKHARSKQALRSSQLDRNRTDAKQMTLGCGFYLGPTLGFDFWQTCPQLDRPRCGSLWVDQARLNLLLKWFQQERSRETLSSN